MRYKREWLDYLKQHNPELWEQALDDLVEIWHNDVRHDATQTGSLMEWLGMNRDEYGLFLLGKHTDHEN